MNDPYRLRYTNQLVGAFLLVVLLFLLGLLLWIVQTKGYFEAKDQYWIEVAQKDVEGLNINADVLILGELAGKVEQIEYIGNTSNLRVFLSIHPEFSKKIYQSSSVALERRLGVGNAILVIRRGMPADGELKQLEPGNQINEFEGEEDHLDRLAREVQSVGDSIRKIQLKLDPTLDKVGKSADTFKDGIQNNANPAFDDLSDASQSMKQTSDEVRPNALATLAQIRTSTIDINLKIADLTNDMKKLIKNDMRETLSDVRETTDEVDVAAKKVKSAATTVESSAEDVENDIEKSLVRFRAAADEVERLAAEAREVVRVARNESEELPGTVRKVQFHDERNEDDGWRNPRPSVAEEIHQPAAKHQPSFTVGDSALGPEPN